MILAALAAWGHEPDCPSTQGLALLVVEGALSEEGLACLGDDEAARWVRWENALHGGWSEQRALEVRALLSTTRSADHALRAAELSSDSSVTTVAVRVAWSLSDQWRQPRMRVGRLDRLAMVDATLDPKKSVDWALGLADLGVTGAALNRARRACMAVEPAVRCEGSAPFPLARSAAAPVADELIACRDLGRLWAVMHLGGVYANERDCMTRALDGLTGPAAAVGARLAVLLAEQHPDSDVTTQVMRRAAPILEGEGALAERAAQLHRGAGDPSGADRWLGGRLLR